MPRPPLPIGSWGKVTRTEMRPKKWRARANFRDFTGRTKRIEAWGKSGADAQRNLEAELRDRVATVSEDITGSMRLHALGQRWLTECEQADLEPQSVAEYRRTFERVIEPGLGGLQIREATVSALDRFLKDLAARTPATAKQAKVVLNGMLGLAARHDAIRSNPVRDTVLPRGKRKAVRALSVEDVAALRRGVVAWQTAPGQKGPKRAPDLLDVVDIMLGTGARIGEVCALRWQDVDLSSERPTVTISGTVVRLKGKGMQRQDHPKTSASRRTVTIPAFTVDTLLKRQVMEYPNPQNVVLPSSTGTLRDPHNLRRQWRDARAAAGFDWVVPHSFRKAVATAIDREADTKNAAAVLGHSGVGVTERHYIERLAIAPDMSAHLEAFGAGVSDEKGG